MPPRLSAPSSLLFVTAAQTGPRPVSRPLSKCGALHGLSTLATERRAQGGLQGSILCPRTTCYSSQQRHTFHSTARRHASGKNPYEVLGLKKDAGASEIKKAYYQLARQYHPDTNKDKDAHDRFVEIQAAYDLLSDEKKRAAYDRYGAASQQEGFDPDAFAAGGRGPFGAGGFGFQDLGSAFGAAGGRAQGDLFETLFGSAFGGRAGRGAGFTESYRGDDIDATVGVSFLEACKGAKRTVTVTPVVDCKACSGSGLKAGAKRSACSSCGGSGTRTFVIESGFQMASTCPSCQGTGTTVPRGSQCGECSGMGKVKVRKTVSVDIPAGVEDGMTIRIPGAGDMPISGQGNAGDLLVRVNVAGSKAFRRQGIHLYHEARIPMHTAVLGGKVRVPTLDGEVEVRVPAGTQQGEECVLRGRGVTPVTGRGEKGDLFVSFVVQLPRTLSQRQRAMFEAYAEDVEGRGRTATSGKEVDGERDGETQQHGTGFSSRAGETISRAWNGMKKLIG